MGLVASIVNKAALVAAFSCVGIWAVLPVVFPHSFVFAAIFVNEYTLATSPAAQPLAFVSIAINILKDTMTIIEVVGEVAFVPSAALIGVDSMTMPLIDLPPSLICVSVLVEHRALAMLLVC